MKQKGKQLKVPRSMQEIQASYQQLCANAGQVQYQINVFTKELAQLNERLMAINNEAAARQQLDAQSKSDGATETLPPQAANETATQSATTGA